jgi:hypothetical protein
LKLGAYLGVFTRDLESPAVSKCAVVHPCLR